MSSAEKSCVEMREVSIVNIKYFIKTFIEIHQLSTGYFPQFVKFTNAAHLVSEKLESVKDIPENQHLDLVK